MTKNNKREKKFIAINRLTNREIVDKDLYFWKTLPRSPKKAEGISDFYFTNIKCKKGHLSPRRTVNRNCLSCEISEENLNKNRKYYDEKREEILNKQKIKYKEETKDNIDARYNEDSPEKRLGKILEELKSEKTLEEYIKRYDEKTEKIIENIDSNDKFFLGEQCHFGHIGLRVNHGSKICYKCKQINGLIDYLSKKDVRQIKSCIYYHKLDVNRKEFIIKKSAERNKNNPESHDISRKKWLKNNPEKRKLVTKRDRQNHKSRVNYHSDEYRSNKLTATPNWLSEKANKLSKAKYEESTHRQNQTGEKHEVDHIMPLKHKVKELGGCCGLNVPWNKEVITRTANRKKGSKLPSPDRYTADEQDRSDMTD